MHGNRNGEDKGKAPRMEFYRAGCLTFGALVSGHVFYDYIPSSIIMSK